MKTQKLLVALLCMIMSVTNASALEYAVEFKQGSGIGQFVKDDGSASYSNDINGVHWTMYATANCRIGFPNFQLCTTGTKVSEIVLELSGIEGVISRVEFTCWQTQSDNNATVAIYDEDLQIEEREIVNSTNAGDRTKVFEGLSLDRKIKLVFRQPAKEKVGIYMGSIKVTYAPIEVTMDEKADNSNTLAAYKGKPVNLMLKRSFTNDGWYTLCLPFSLTADGVGKVFGEKAEVEEFVSVTTNSSGQQELTFAVADGGIRAGIPCLIKPVKEDVINPVFENVTITAIEPETVERDGYLFVGTLNPMELEAAETTRLLGGNDGAVISRVSEAGILFASRCYFVFPAAYRNVAQRISLDRTVDIGDRVVCDGLQKDGKDVYTLHGMKIDGCSALSAGIYIVKGKKVYIHKQHD